MSALVVALDRSEPEDRPDILQWVAERGLLGLVHECGVRAAAAFAYQVADGLAGAVR
jgi:hypothetical protein